MNLAQYKVADYIDKAKDSTSVPGGGSIAALCGALSAALLTMVNNLSKNKDIIKSTNKIQQEKIKDIIARTQDEIAELREIIHLDTEAFNFVLIALKLPQNTFEEVEYRKEQLEKGYENAIAVPEKVVELTLQILKDAKYLIDYSTRDAISDMGMAVLLAYTALEGSGFNILINLKGIKNKEKFLQIKEKYTRQRKEAETLKDEVLKLVYERI